MMPNRRMLELLRHRSLPTTASTAARLAFLRSAWFAVDAAMAALDEIRFEVRHRASFACGFQRHDMGCSASTPVNDDSESSQ